MEPAPADILNPKTIFKVTTGAGSSAAAKKSESGIEITGGMAYERKDAPEYRRGVPERSPAPKQVQVVMDQSRKEEGIRIPHDQLSPDALRGLIEEFVTRNGTDNGDTRSTLEQNVLMVMGQLNRGEAVILYDQNSQTANIVPNPSS